MHFQQKLRGYAALGLIVVASLFSASALAECSDSRVKRMGAQGKTISSIAKICDMSTGDVRSILDEEAGEEEGSDEPADSGLPRGAPVGQCGCWGYVDPQFLQPHPQCNSGYARPSSCNSMCPAGGYAWRGICT